jgi:hypothetical protein
MPLHEGRRAAKSEGNSQFVDVAIEESFRMRGKEVVMAGNTGLELVPKPIEAGPEMQALRRFFRTAGGRGGSTRAGWDPVRRR